MQNPPINNQNNDENQFSEGLINFYICTRTNTAKIIHSPDATGKITIKEFVIHNNINYIIQEIDDNAFSGTQIESLAFEPNSHVKRIGNYAFQKSTIKSIEIPDSLEELGETWCSEANYLTDIKINNNHPKFKYKDKLLTTLDGSEIIFANRNIVRLNLTTNVHKILPSAFYKCAKITSISIKTSTIEYIGPSAFYECEKLQSILITGENLQNLTLDERCFAFCQSLKKIDINCNSLKIGYNCFECCVSIEELIFPVKSISFDEGSVSGCENLSSLKIPDAENIKIKKFYRFISIKRNSF